MNKEDAARLRDNIRKSLFNEAAFGGTYSQIHQNPHQKEKAEPSDVEVTDETVGVMEYKFDPKSMENIDYTLQKLEPYFDDIEVQYVGINEESDGVSVNVKHRYKDLLDALMAHYGFTKDIETWGDEMRSGKRVYTTRTNSASYGNGYPMPILLGEYPASAPY